MSTAPHLWRLVLEARRAGARLVVVDPFRSRTARVADEHLAPAARHRRRAGAGDDARGRGRRAPGRRVVPRAHVRLRRAAGAARTTTRWSAARTICGVEAEAIERVGREFATTQPALLRLGRGRAAPLRARRWPTARSPACPRSPVRGATPGGGCSYIPTATAAAISEEPLQRADLRPGEVRRINMSQVGDALTDPSLDPPVKALVCWNSNPAQVAPEQGKVLAGPAPRRPLHRRARAVHDRHRRCTPTWCCRPPPSWSTSTWSSPGATTGSRCRSRRSSRWARPSRTRRRSG